MVDFQVVDLEVNAFFYSGFQATGSVTLIKFALIMCMMSFIIQIFKNWLSCIA